MARKLARRIDTTSGVRRLPTSAPSVCIRIFRSCRSDPPRVAPSLRRFIALSDSRERVQRAWVWRPARQPAAVDKLPAPWGLTPRLPRLSGPRVQEAATAHQSRGRRNSGYQRGHRGNAPGADPPEARDSQHGRTRPLRRATGHRVLTADYCPSIDGIGDKPAIARPANASRYLTKSSCTSEGNTSAMSRLMSYSSPAMTGSIRHAGFASPASAERGRNFDYRKSCDSTAIDASSPSSRCSRSALIAVTPSWICSQPSTSRKGDSTTIALSRA